MAWHQAVSLTTRSSSTSTCRLLVSQCYTWPMSTWPWVLLTVLRLSETWAQAGVCVATIAIPWSYFKPLSERSAIVYLLGSGQQAQDVSLSCWPALLALQAVPDAWKCCRDGCLNAMELSTQQLQELGPRELVHVTGFGGLLHNCRRARQASVSTSDLADSSWSASFQIFE